MAAPIAVQVPRCAQWELRARRKVDDALFQLKPDANNFIDGNLDNTVALPEGWEPIGVIDHSSAIIMLRRCTRWE